MNLYAFASEQSIIKYPIGLSHLREKYSSTSFPSTFTEFDYSSYGVVEVVPKDISTYDPDTQRVVEGTPALKNGTWEQVWKIEPLSAEEQQQILDGKVASVRSERAQKLFESDWTQFNDSPLDEQSKTTWAQYRQELRDITLQEGFPHNIVWPTKP